MTILRESRTYDGEVEFRANATGGGVLVGYAAKFNRLSQNLGGFVEQISPGAFTKTLTEADVRGLFNHDANLVLGRIAAGTMRSSEDGTGLHYEIDHGNTTVANDVRTMIERGDVTGSSFTFRALPNGDAWDYTDQGFPRRTLTEVQLFDVGPVTFPAYLDTEASVRSALTPLAEQRSLDVDALVAAAGRNELRAVLEGNTEDTDEPEPPSTPGDLSIARRRLELIARRRHLGAA